MENLGIDYRLIIAQLINFAVFFFIFFKFIAKPFFNFIKKEKTDEETKQKLMVELEKSEETLKEREKELIAKMKKEQSALIEDAKKDAEKLKTDIIAQAQKEASEIVAKAKEQITDEKNALYREMKEQLASLSTIMVRKALGEYLTGDAQKEVTQNILRNLPDDVKKYES